MSTHVGPLTVKGGYIDMDVGGEIRHFVFENVSSDPTVGYRGQPIWNFTSGKLRICTVASGTSPTWVDASGGGDASTNTSSSTDSEMVLFSSTGGKTLKRSNVVLAGPGLVKVNAGVVSVASAGSDYLTPTGDGSALTGITQSQVSGLVAALALLAPLASPALTGTPTAPTATGGTNTTQVATTAFVQTAVGGVVAAADALVFKGGIDCSVNPNYPAADAGWFYKVTVAGKIGGASGVNVEAGDSLICTVDSTAAGNQATVGANWLIIQTNLDAAAMAGSGLTNTGNVLNVNPGAGVVISGDTVAIDTASVVRYLNGTLGNGTLHSYAITHGLTLANKYRQRWTLYDTVTDEEITANIIPTSTTVTTVDFGSVFTPTTNQIAWFATFGA